MEQENEVDLDLDVQEEEEGQEEGQAEGPSELELANARIAELESKNAQLYARYRKDDAKAAKKANFINPPAQGEDKSWQKKIDFVTQDGKDLDSDEVKEVIAYAEGKKLSYAEALKSKVIQAYLNERKTEKSVQSATPSSSGTSTFTYKDKTWATMTSDERKANFAAYMASRARK